MHFIISIDSVSTDSRHYDCAKSDENCWLDIYDGNIYNDTILTNAFSYKNKTIKLDKGWHTLDRDKDVVWFKGYSTEARLIDRVEARNYSSMDGNYCFIVFDKTTECINIYHDTNRGFGIYYTDSIITNLYTIKTCVKFDGCIMVDHNDEIIVSSLQTTFTLPDIIKDKSIDDMAAIIAPMMIKKIEGFMKYNNVVDLEIQATGGLDTLTVRALLDICAIDYKLIDIKPFKDGCNWTNDTNSMMDILSKYHWGFQQCNYYDDITYVATGFWGDELLMRNPLQVHWILNHYDIDLSNEYTKHPDSYMLGYFQQAYKEKLIERDKIFSNENELYQYSLDYALDEPQITHVDNVIMFSPFKGIDIYMKTLNMTNEAILEQVINGALQKKIIYDINPKLLDCLEKYKNRRIPV